MYRQSLISLTRLSQIPQVILVRIYFISSLYFREHLSLTTIEHMSQYGIRCHGTLHQKKVHYLQRQYKNMNITSMQMHKLVFLWRQHCSRTKRYILNPLYSTCIKDQNILITLVNLSSLLGKGNSSLLVHSMLINRRRIAPCIVMIIISIAIALEHLSLQPSYVRLAH